MLHLLAMFRKKMTLEINWKHIDCPFWDKVQHRPFSKINKKKTLFEPVHFLKRLKKTEKIWTTSYEFPTMCLIIAHINIAIYIFPSRFWLIPNKRALVPGPSFQSCYCLLNCGELCAVPAKRKRCLQEQMSIYYSIIKFVEAGNVDLRSKENYSI